MLGAEIARDFAQDNAWDLQAAAAWDEAQARVAPTVARALGPEMRRLYAAGESQRAIAARFGVPRSTVQWALGADRRQRAAGKERA